MGRRTAAPTKIAGGPETIIYSGYISPREKNPKLYGREKFRTYNQNLANISIVAAGVRYFLNIVSKAKWAVEDPTEASTDQKTKSGLILEMMHDMDVPWHRVVRRQAMYRFFGFAIQEWIAKRRDDGLVGIKSVEIRPQSTIERWDRDEYGMLQGAVQRIPQNSSEVYLAMSKVIYSVEDQFTDSPEGQGSFRGIVEVCDRLKKFHDLELLGYETDLRGIPIGRAPISDSLAQEKAGSIAAGATDKLLKPLNDFIHNHVRNRDTGVMLDSTPYFAKGETGTVGGNSRKWDLDLLTAASSSTGEIASAIQRLTHEIALVLGVDHLLTGTDGTGSLALSKDKTDNFLLNVNSLLQDLSEDFTKQWLKPIWMLNGWDEYEMPVFKVEEINNRSAENISTMLRDISAAGADIRGHDELVKEFFNMIGLTPPERDEEDSMDPSLSLLPTGKPTEEIVNPEEK